MNLKMSLKPNPKLAADLISFLNDFNAAKQGTERFSPGLSDDLLSAFRESFKSGGLDQVDDLIDSINESIKQSGGTKGLGLGAALEHETASKPACLHISFAEFETDKIFLRSYIPLN